MVYHVTFADKAKKILKSGLYPDKPNVTRGRLGQKLSKPGYVYAFSDYEDAVMWASKMGWDFKDPVVIIVIDDNASNYEYDKHFESSYSYGHWLMKKGHVPADKILATIPFTPEMAKEAVKISDRLFASKMSPYVPHATGKRQQRARKSHSAPGLKRL